MMRAFLKKGNARLSSFVDWFIPNELKASRDLVQAVRMFLFSHIFGPFLGHTISFSMLYLQGGADVSWWIFFIAVTAFWPFTLVLRLTGWYVPLALLSIENLIFCVLWGAYHYGGVNSPILPWLVTVPLLAFFYLPERKTRIIIGFQIISNLALFYVIYSVFGFPESRPLDGLAVLGLVSTFCASVYVSMMALYYASSVSSQAELEREIDLHKATAAELREATWQIERAMAAKSEFLAKMSHELRNPLNSIIGYSEILLEAVEVDGQKSKDLISIRNAGHRLLELINDLLDLAKLEAGKAGLHRDQVALTDLFDELATEWLPAITAKGNAFKVEPPPAAEFYCDATKLKRIVANLLSNAAKFTEFGRVMFSSSLENGVLAFSVQDTGVGIAVERLAGLFETFGNSGEETASNYGQDVRLGLPLAHRYCRLMGGEISVESELGLGSRFTVRLPIQLISDGPEDRLKTEPLSHAA
jgi:signal transduction histidine kinase